MKRQYLKGPLRYRKILTAAFDISVTKGYQNITRDDVAEAAQVATGLVNHYFNTMALLRKEVMKEAIRREHGQIVAQGLSVMDPVAIGAPDSIKDQAAAWLMS